MAPGPRCRPAEAGRWPCFGVPTRERRARGKVGNCLPMRPRRHRRRPRSGRPAERDVQATLATSPGRGPKAAPMVLISSTGDAGPCRLARRFESIAHDRESGDWRETNQFAQMLGNTFPPPGGRASVPSLSVPMMRLPAAAAAKVRLQHGDTPHTALTSPTASTACSMGRPVKARRQ